jgi:hypothetical protein
VCGGSAEWFLKLQEKIVSALRMLVRVVEGLSQEYNAIDALLRLLLLLAATARAR